LIYAVTPSNILPPHKAAVKHSNKRLVSRALLRQSTILPGRWLLRWVFHYRRSGFFQPKPT